MTAYSHRLERDDLLAVALDAKLRREGRACLADKDQRG
jgi:hypothetical protein